MKRFRFSAYLSACLIFPAVSLVAANYTVSNGNDSGAGSLREAMTNANANAGSTITFDGSISGSTITLQSALPNILVPVTIGGTGNLIVDGANAYSGFFIETGAGSVSISNFTLQHCLSEGGAGGSASGSLAAAGGGGGLGAGGGLTVSSGNSVTLSTMQFSHNSAVGGQGGSTQATPSVGGLGGGGFCGGAGGSSTTSITTGGGGGGVGGTDGLGDPTYEGGTGSDASSGGSGLDTASGGGGGGGVAGFAGSTTVGGAGGGTGGGGGGVDQGGNGAFGGGGGGGATGGDGGFGGGGGGGGGFGGSSLFAGGIGSSSGAGGGGAGLGGAIFLMADSTSTSSLEIHDNMTFTSNAASGGAGGTDISGNGGSGEGLGTDIFMASGSTVTFNLAGSLTVSSNIDSDHGAGGGTGGGVVKTGPGSLTLSGINSYTGGTTVSQGSLTITSDDNVGGTAATVTLSGGTLIIEAPTPSPPPTTGLLFWYDATDVSTVTTSSGSVTQWVPRAGSAVSTMTLTPGSAPHYTSGVSVDFSSAASTYLVVNNSPSWTTGTVFVSMAGSDASTTAYVYGTDGPSSSPTIITGYIPNTTEFFHGGGVRLIIEANPPAGFGVYAATYDVASGGETGQGYFNGGATGSDTQATSPAAINFLFFGAANSTVNYVDASIAHWLVYNTQLSSGEISSVSNYLLGTGGGGASNLSIGIVVPVSTTGTVEVVSGVTSTLNTTAIDNAGTFVKSGAGTLVLNVANSYAGATSITAGTLQAGMANGFSPNSAFTLSNVLGVTLSLNSIDSTIASLAGGGSTGGVVNLGSATLTTGDSASTTFSGVISGTGSLIKQGSGTFTLNTSANTYSGGTTISAGTLSIGNTSSLGTGFATLSAGATLDIQSGIDLTNNLTLSGAGSISTTSGTATLSAVVSGSGGSFTKTGAGTLVLNNSNTYDNGTTVATGTLSMGSDLAFGTGTITINSSETLNFQDTISCSNDLVLGTAANLSMTSGAATISGIISGDSFVKTGAGTLVLSNSNTFTGGGTISTGTLSIANNTALGSGTATIASDATLDVQSSVTASNALALGSGANVFVQSGTATLSGVISGNSLVKTGSGTLVLNNSNSFTGGTTISAGVLSISNNTALGSGTATLANATLNVGSGVNASNAIALSGAETISVNSGNGVLSGGISGSGSITKTGSGIITLSSSANNYTGTTTVEAGALQLSASGTIASSSSLTLNGAGFDIAPLSGNTSVNNLSGDSGSSIDLGTNSLTINQSVNRSYDGTFLGSGTLIKSGSGVLQLGTNDPRITANISLSQGEINLNNANLANAPLSSSVGTRLTGNGTVGSFVNHGNISPGNSIGTISVNGDLHLDNADSIITIEVDSSGASDLIDVTGTAFLGGQLVITPLPGSYDPTQSFEILAAGAISGEFSSIVSSNPRFTFIPQYGPTAFFVSFTEGSGPLFTGMTFSTYNAQAVANNLIAIDNKNSFEGDPDLGSIAALLNEQPQSIAQQNLEKMHDSQITAFTEEQVRTASFLMQLVEGRDKCGGQDALTYAIWIEPYAYFFNVDHMQDQVAFHSTTEGIIAGAECAPSDHWSIGMIAAYDNTQLHWNEERGRGTKSSGYAGLYVQNITKYTQIDLFCIRGLDYYDVKRKIEFVDAPIERTASNTHSGTEVAIRLSGTVNIGCEPWSVFPFASVEYIRTYQESFKEQNADSLNLSVDSLTTQTLEEEVGIGFRATKRVRALKISPMISLSGVMDQALERPKIRSHFRGQDISFEVKGWNKNWKFLRPAVALELSYEKFLLKAEYEAELRNGFVGQGVGLRLEWDF